MHSKMKGGIGVAEVALYLLSRGIPCFVELLCDNSKIDLIAETTRGLKTIQVRSTRSKDGAATLSVRSVTPGTRRTACKVSRITGVDIFALHVSDRDVIVFVDAQEIGDIGTNVVFRFDPPKNGQNKGIRLANNYFSPSFLETENPA